MSDISETTTPPTVPATGASTTTSVAAPTTNEPHSIQITSIKLNGDNFVRWSQSVQMYIRGRGKTGYLTGTIPEPAPEDPHYAKWDSENSMVMTWLVNSMEEDISSNYLCYPTARELWENINQMYSDLGNQSQVYEITLKLEEVKQGGDSVTKYFNTLKRLWQELDMFTTIQWQCTADGSLYKKKLEDGRIFKFLIGLNVEFDEVRGRIISRQPLPSLGEVFSEVRREESRRIVMLGKNHIPGNVEGSALATTGPGKAAGQKPSTKEIGEKSRVWCDHCNKPRHTRETCWKLHGKPGNWKGSHEGRFNKPASANQVLSNTLSQEQIGQLLKLLDSNSGLSSASNLSLAQTGKIHLASSALKQSSPWILDSGASNHMTSLSKCFKTYTPTSGFQQIKTADGSLSPIVGKGSVDLTSDIKLKNVLHVPRLSCNLLSIHKLCKDSNCHVDFYTPHCLIQEMGSGRKIGSAKQVDGMYLLDGGEPRAGDVQGIGNAASPAADSIMLWHCRLGHPSVNYLKRLFPRLFTSDLPKFTCEHCILSKSHRTVYHPRPYQASKPFYTIHSDIWGPSRTPTPSNKRWFVTFIDDHTRMCWIYLMSEKSEVGNIFEMFYNMIENVFHTKISILHTDNGAEYFKNTLHSFMSEKRYFASNFLYLHPPTEWYCRTQK